MARWMAFNCSLSKSTLALKDTILGESTGADFECVCEIDVVEVVDVVWWKFPSSSAMSRIERSAAKLV